jgi:hypothetical protein
MKLMFAILFLSVFGNTKLSHATELSGGLYATVGEDAYFDALISVNRDLNGDVTNLTERFVVEGIPTKPFYFTCENSLCTNLEKPFWTIKIISKTEYEDRYNTLKYRFVLIDLFPDDE